jgi:hypothetical protein
MLRRTTSRVFSRMPMTPGPSKIPHNFASVENASAISRDTSS